MQSFVVLTKPQRWKKYIYMMYIISNPALGEGEYWYIIRKNIHNEGGFSMFSPTKKLRQISMAMICIYPS